MEHPAKGLAFARLQRTYRCGSFDFAQDDHGLGKVLALPPFALRRMGHPFFVLIDVKIPRLASRTWGTQLVLFASFVLGRYGEDEQADAGYVIGFAGHQVFGALA